MKILLILSLTVFSFCEFGDYDYGCHFTCLTCNQEQDFTACTSCMDSARLKNGRCVCPRGMGMTNYGTCESCDPSCKTCALAHTDTHCHTCKDPSATLTEVSFMCIDVYPPPPQCAYYEKETGSCVCPSGKVLNEKGQCEKESKARCRRGYHSDSKKSKACLL